MGEMMEISKALWCLLIAAYIISCVGGPTFDGDPIGWWKWPGLAVIFTLLIGGGLVAAGFVLYALAYPLIQWLTPIILPLITPQ